ncbi:hypothetical protein, partial [Streptomyces sp. NPDC094468]|uniref:hypothetical protein n=1 Tax=Streptomyces sp. NPDC094468 TaxID=3366066 RepID=UPI0037FEE5EB
TTHTTTPTPPQPHEPPAPPHNTNQPPPYKIQHKIAAFLSFEHYSTQVGEKERRIIERIGVSVANTSLNNAKAGLPPLSIEIIGHSNGLRNGFPDHGLAKERGLERANAVADYFREILPTYAAYLEKQGKSFDPGLIQITPRTAGDDLPHRKLLNDDPYAARCRAVIRVSGPSVSTASVKRDQAAEGSTTAHRPSQEERGEETEIQQLTDQIRRQFDVRLDSEEGIRAAVESSGVTDPDVIAEIKPVPWTVRRLRHVAAALKHYKPILGKNRDTSSRSGIEQEVNTIGNITWLIESDKVHEINSRVAGQFAYRYKTFNLATYVQNPEFTATHELAHGLLQYVEPQFVNEFWTGIRRPTASTPLEDFVNAIAVHLSDPEKFKDVAPRYAEVMGVLAVHEPGVIKILPGETHRDAVKRIVEMLGGHLPWFMQQVGTWTADGRPDIFFPRERPITEYGKNNFREDLAETAAVYFTDIGRLRSGAPLRAAFMDRLVEGWKQRREADPSMSASPDLQAVADQGRPAMGGEGSRSHVKGFQSDRGTAVDRSFAERVTIDPVGGEESRESGTGVVAEAVRQSVGGGVSPRGVSGVGGGGVPRFVVRSGFDVRGFRVGGTAVTDLTVRVALRDTRGQDTEKVWQSLLEGTEEYYNRPGHLLPGGDLLHVTV